MRPNSFTSIRGRVPKLPSFLLGLVPIIVLLAIWWYATSGPAEYRAVSPTILPSPVEVLSSAPELVNRRELFHHARVSLVRVAAGFGAAVVVVVPLAVLMGAFGLPRSMFAPVTTASGYIPIATLVPLTMAWFGTDEKQKIVFLAMAFAVYLLPMVLKAVDNVPEVYLRTSYTLGSSRLQTIFKVLIPVAMPDIWHGMRLAFGVGWTYLVLAEVVDMQYGLGALVEISRRRGPREHIYLVILTITLIAWMADLLWAYAGHLMFPYRRSKT